MLRYWLLFGNGLFILGLVAFLAQPVIGVAVVNAYLYVFTPSASLILMVVGVLIRIDCAVRDI